MNGHKFGLALGIFAGFVHLVWSVLVGFNLAEPFSNWIFRLHFVAPAHTFIEFNVGTAISLILLATVVGYVVGRVFGFIWNWAEKL